MSDGKSESKQALRFTWHEEKKLKKKIKKKRRRRRRIKKESECPPNIITICVIFII